MPGPGSSLKEVAIYVPTYRSELSADEQISVRHLEHYLGAYDKFLVIPDNLNVSVPGCRPIRFDPAYFTSAQAYSRLCLSEELYRAFMGYKYILCYQLDCLVFSDRLSEWCAKGYDYIGAPWFKRPGFRWLYPGPELAGNGGLSLRHVAHSLDAIRRSNQMGITDILDAAARVRYSPRIFRDLKRALLLKRNSAARFSHAEDIWWAMHASTYLPSFRIAPVEAAVDFSFETDPRYCFEKNGQRLPFGCHAWARYDREFWEPYLLA
jgi:hypothetical protein